jgi:hypothetical protein
MGGFPAQVLLEDVRQWIDQDPGEDDEGGQHGAGRRSRTERKEDTHHGNPSGGVASTELRPA